MLYYIVCKEKEYYFCGAKPLDTIMLAKNLVIVESPSKAKTIERFLGNDFTVTSSKGHVRDLKTKGLSIDEKTFEPDYEIPADKLELVASLRTKASKADKVWLASDEDREGEAIAWHLCEVLGLNETNTNRIVFHEITKPAILAAIENPRHIDINLVNAQQARRLLDRMVGFKLSPVLWKKVKPSLSAGRVQSVAVRLVVEREREIQHFKPESFYRVWATLTLPAANGRPATDIRAEIPRRLSSKQQATELLGACRNARFVVTDIVSKPLKRSPAPPFTTSTLQQEAARRLGLSVSQTMRVAQRLYENGLITYMRTDSVNLSRLCLADSKRVIASQYGDSYCHTRNFHTHAKGAQEAHEAIRPTHMEHTQISGTAQEKNLYGLIWKRTIASQMTDAQIEKTTVNISIRTSVDHLRTTVERAAADEMFVATGERIVFDGFTRVYHDEGHERMQPSDDALQPTSASLPGMEAGMELMSKEVCATQRYTQPPARYSEASLVHKMEELGIGRPSTYAPTISIIQEREYVVKGEKADESKDYLTLTLTKGEITEAVKKEKPAREKARLIPTDVGIVVNDYLSENFQSIMDYNFTASLEQQFDDIADGKADWKGVLHRFYSDFEPAVERAVNSRSEHKVGERVLGIDPASGRQVLVKIAKFGPVVQIGRAEEEEKPSFADLPKGVSMEEITLEQALDVFKLPRTLGQFEGTDVVANVGRYGPYIRHNGKFVSIEEGMDPLTITLSSAVALIERKRLADRQKHIATLTDEKTIDILNGRFGPYLVCEGKNYHIPKPQQKHAASLTYEQCCQIMEQAAVQARPKNKRAATRRRK